MSVDSKFEDVSENVIKISGENLKILEKCLHPKETDSFDCVLNVG